MAVPRRIREASVDAVLIDCFDFIVGVENAIGSIVGDHASCAAACALKKRKDIAGAWVMRTRTYIEFIDGRILRYLNPAPLQRAVEQFDLTAGLFPPGKYRLLPVQYSQTSEARRDRPRSYTGAVDEGLRQIKRRSRPAYALR